jgi:concanavalin A-like lectin/glucanase superfamily protein
VPQKQHVMHGRDHCPGGADPIPCMISAPSGPGDYYAIATAIPDLRGYWRLGETGEPWLDSSGYNVGSPANAELETGTAPLEPDITGALPAAYDDGAVEFNYPGTGIDTVSERLLSINSADGRFNFNISEETHKNMTVAVWVRPQANANTFTDYAMTCFATVAGSPSWISGWGITLAYPSRTPTFTRFQNVGATGPYEATAGAPLDADQWTHLAGTYDGSDLRLYVDGTLADTTADTHDLSSINRGVTFGLRSVAALDEAAVWARVLTADQVAQLADSGIEGGEAAAGSVLTADGDGGWSWAVPTIEVTY